MPDRLRPTAPTAADAILVGDPGRALMLAQVLLTEPRMSNHARGLWGYSGKTAAGRDLTLQATGIGGPSAAIVLADLAELGVRRAIRVGTCSALTAELRSGDLLNIAEAHAWGGPGGHSGEAVQPDSELFSALGGQLGDQARTAAVASLDSLHRGGLPSPLSASEAADMQTATLFARGDALGVAVAAVLIVTAASDGEPLDDEKTKLAAEQAGVAASLVLSSSS
jgi:uridine phosphorylase